MKKVAVFPGRFQPLHLGHVHAIRQAMKKYKVIIVIGSTNKQDAENPFTFEQRKKMIRAVFGRGIKIIGVPDVYNDLKWVKSIEAKVKFDLAITGNEWSKRCFTKAGYKIVEPDLLEPEKYKATRIRNLISKNQDWENLVPKEVSKLIKTFHLKRNKFSSPFSPLSNKNIFF
jgi:nicotinamide-nucleotide adenylyltransferase